MIKKNILVTACGGPAGVNTLRLLSTYDDIQVFGVDVDVLSAGQIFASQFRVVAPFHLREEYGAHLRQVISDWKIDVVIPTLADELADIHEMLQGVPVDIVLSSPSTTRLCGDKAAFYDWAQAHVPQYMVRHARLSAPLSWKADQYFLKPVEGRGSRGCRMVTPEVLQAFLAEVDTPSDWVVMEPLSGMEWTVDAYIDREGLVRYVVPRERLEVVAGISRKGRTVKHDAVIQGTLDILALLPFRGPVCIQWKADETGAPKLLEVNARMSGGIMITVLSGANPMALLHAELMGLPLESPKWEPVIGVGFTTYARLDA